MALSKNPFAGQAKVVFALVVAALAGGISGGMFAYSPDLPEVSTLDDYAPNTITRIYAAGGIDPGDGVRRIVVQRRHFRKVWRVGEHPAADATGEGGHHEREDHLGLSGERIL